MDRRHFIGATAAAGAMAVAGCSALGIGSDGPEDVVENYIEDSWDIEDPWEDLEEYEHSLMRDDDDDEDDDEEDELLEVETEVTDEDLDEEDVEEFFTFGGLEEDEIEDLVDEEDTAIVEAEITYTEDGDEEEDEIEFLLATDEGDWKILTSGPA